MDEKEYEKFMTYLYNEYVRPRRTRFWRHFRHFDEWHYPLVRELERLRNASNLIRFINRNCPDEDEIYRTITLERIKRLPYEVSNGVSLNNRLTEESGFLDAFDGHYDEIVEGMKLEHMPRQEIDIMRDFGSEDPEAELSALMYIVKSRRKAIKSFNQEVTISNQLRQIEEHLDYQRKQMEELEDKEEKPPKKSKRWFKGLGQIAQGSALSIANIGLAMGVLSFPVAAETAGWGALVSSITGVGMMLNGVGEFRGE